MIDEIRERLDALARTLPCRPIRGADGSVYLYRFTLGALPDGGLLYLHRFMRSDEDQELHNHPWNGRSLILAGGYREERRFPIGTPAQRMEALRLQRHGWAWDPADEGLGEEEGRRIGHLVLTREYRRGAINVIEPDTFHRVDLLEEDCWSLLATGPVVQSWGFWDRHTGVFTPWREFIARKGLVTS